MQFLVAFRHEVGQFFSIGSHMHADYGIVFHECMIHRGIGNATARESDYE